MGKIHTALHTFLSQKEAEQDFEQRCRDALSAGLQGVQPPLLIEQLFLFRYSRNLAVQLYTFSFCRVPFSDARSGIGDKRKPEATKAPKFLRAASD